jgi:hypothetical protein
MKMGHVNIPTMESLGLNGPTFGPRISNLFVDIGLDQFWDDSIQKPPLCKTTWVSILVSGNPLI